MDSKYILGCEKVDAHHAILIDLLNDLHAKLGLHTVTLDDLLFAKQSLKNYVIHHFSLEEQLMASTNYAGAVEHHHQHSRFANRVENLTIPPDEEVELRLVTLDLVVALTSWLIRHIMSEDQKLIDWLKENHPELL